METQPIMLQEFNPDIIKISVTTIKLDQLKNGYNWCIAMKLCI